MKKGTDRMLTIYGLSHCSTTKKAANYLMAKGIEMGDIIDIRDATPTKKVIQLAVAANGGQVKKIINTSGNLYREMDLKDKLAEMSNDDVVALLHENGMLIKRPLITNGEKATVSAKESSLSAWLS